MDLTADQHRALGIALFNATWELIDVGDQRTPADDAEMLRRAYASAYHWTHVARPVERVRSDWQLARVWALLGNGPAALFHARAAHETGEAAGWEGAEGFADFDQAAVLEALARAHAASGAMDAARTRRAQAQAAGASISESGDREYFLADLAGGPWFGLE